MSDRDLRELTEADQSRLARAVMRKQARLSLRVAAMFLILILGLPILNAALPELMNESWFGGFTPTWLFLGVLFYPITIGLSFYFVGASDQIEADCVDWRTILGEDESR